FAPGFPCRGPGVPLTRRGPRPILAPGPRTGPATARIVSDTSLRAIADQRFAHALARAGARDPRDFYRERLRALRERDEGAFHRALQYYERRLLPAVASPDSDPLAEWLEYGRILAELSAEGRTVQVDRTG